MCIYYTHTISTKQLSFLLMKAHSFIFSIHSMLVRIMVDVEPIQGTLDMRMKTSWMGCQSITKHQLS